MANQEKDRQMNIHAARLVAGKLDSARPFASLEDEIRQAMHPILEKLEEKRGMVGCVSFGTEARKFIILPKPIDEHAGTDVFVVVTEYGFKGIRFSNDPKSWPKRELLRKLGIVRATQDGIVTEGYIKPPWWGAQVNFPVGYYNPLNYPSLSTDFLGITVDGSSWTFHRWGSLIDITNSTIAVQAVEASLAMVRNGKGLDPNILKPSIDAAQVILPILS